MPTTFIESDLQFVFSDNWVIKAYDDHPFYKALAGNGLKGVDFIGILNQETVVLIEVKNYKIRFPTVFPPIQDKITGTTPAIVDTMLRKAVDTRRALRIFRKYYERRWWLHPFAFLIKILPVSYQLKIEWNFWLAVERKVHQRDYILTLWMELEEEYDFFSKEKIKKAREKVLEQLQIQFEKTKTQIIIADRFKNKIGGEEVIIEEI